MLHIEKEYKTEDGVTVTVTRWGKTTIIGRDHGGPSPAACKAFDTALHQLAGQVVGRQLQSNRVGQLPHGNWPPPKPDVPY